MKKSIRLHKETKGSREFNAIIERDAEDYFVASVLELPGCHTQAKTLDTLEKRLREAIKVYLEVQKTDDEPSSFVGVPQIKLQERQLSPKSPIKIPSIFS